MRPMTTRSTSTTAPSTATSNACARNSSRPTRTSTSSKPSTVSATASRRRKRQGEAMAVETDGSGFGAGAREALKRSLSSSVAHICGFAKYARVAGRYAGRAAAGIRAFARRIHLYELLTTGPLIRFVSKTLQRRIIFANTIGLAILLGGIFYLSQYHAWLIDAKRESLRAQGDIIAAAIAANASIETGRLVLHPDRLPELEGA